MGMGIGMGMGMGMGTGMGQAGRDGGMAPMAVAVAGPGGPESLGPSWRGTGEY